MDEACAALVHLRHRHPRHGDFDGRCLGIRSVEFWRILGVGSRGELFLGTLADPGRRCPPPVDQPQPKEAHGAVQHVLLLADFILAGFVQHLPDQVRNPRRYVGAQLCRQRHSPPIVGVRLEFCGTGTLHVAPVYSLENCIWSHPRPDATCCHEGVCGRGHWRFPHHVGRYLGQSVPSGLRTHRGRGVHLGPRILDVRWLVAVSRKRGPHHLANQLARFQPIFGAAQPPPRTMG